VGRRGIFVQLSGNKPPPEVSVRDVDRFVDQQVEQGLCPTTINCRLATLRTFFEFLAAEEPDKPYPNPVIWRRHRVKQGEPLPRDLPDSAVGQLFAAIDDDRDCAMFGLMVGAGLRVGEVAALLTSRPGSAHVSRPDGSPTSARKRAQRARRLAHPNSVRDGVYLVQKRPNSTHAHLFLNQHGRPLSVAGIQYRLKQHAESAGIRVTCHQW
jgi:site-specific recombinase XerD